MRILTYNLWDSPAGMPEREKHIRQVILSCNADILCLQEVSDTDILHTLAEAAACPYIQYSKDSGIAVLTGKTFLPAWQYRYASAVILKEKTFTVQIVNVHLPWNSAAEREEAVLRINRQAKNQDADYTILTGDFNGTDTDAVHRYLMGECSLRGSDAYYFDLALSYASKNKNSPLPTLDFHHNPRWGIWEPENTLEIPMRCDRIYLRNPYPKPLPVLQACGIFGTEIFPETGLCASDHYGVYADLQF